MVLCLKDKHTSCLTHQVACRLAREGRGDGRVARGKVLELVEAGHHGGREEGLAAAGDEDITLTSGEEAVSLPNRHCPTCTLSTVASDAVVRSLRVHLHRGHAAAAVHDEGGDDEGRDLLEALERKLGALEVLRALVDPLPASKARIAPSSTLGDSAILTVSRPLLRSLLVELRAADGRAHENAEPGLVRDAVLIELGVCHAQLGAGYTHVHVSALPLCLLLVCIPIGGREPVQLPRNVAGEVVGPRGKLGGANLAVKEVWEKLVCSVADARQAPQTCHHHLLVGHGAVRHHPHARAAPTGGRPSPGDSRREGSPPCPHGTVQREAVVKAQSGGSHRNHCSQKHS
mmetsp:Transcript_41377/g.80853  ORF Transcript_41377/g.80853 Transcript_41377/m.80853 type:complete len:345 (-) Transcript_41377:125-1159(-)